jgi:hypothetical protein
MSQQANSSMRADDVLAPFLAAASDVEADRLLNAIFTEHVDPIVLAVLRKKLGLGSGRRRTASQLDDDLVDLNADIRVRLATRLQSARRQPDDRPIADLRGYVAMTAYNSVNMYLRKKRPKRYSLENKLTYLLEHQPGLALWRNERNEAVAGFEAWRTTPRFGGGRLQQLLDSPQSFARGALGGDDPSTMSPGRLIGKMLDFVGHPIELDDLVSVVAELWGVRDLVDEAIAEDDRLADSAAVGSVHEEVQGRFDLRRYWLEIAQLPPGQCASLLLQSRDPDGNSLIELLETEGVASLRAIAAAIDLSVQVLAALWNDLPLDDARIAEHLGVTTQHITRMRMMARRRIAERLATVQ